MLQLWLTMPIMGEFESVLEARLCQCCDSVWWITSFFEASKCVSLSMENDVQQDRLAEERRQNWPADEIEETKSMRWQRNGRKRGECCPMMMSRFIFFLVRAGYIQHASALRHVRD